MRSAWIFTLIVSFSVLVPSSLKSQTIAFEPAQVYPMDHVPESLAFGDLNGDGKLDVIAGNTFSDTTTGGTVSVLLGDGDGTFQTSLPPFSVNGHRPEGVALALIDADTILDVITSNFEGDAVSVLLGRGDGTFKDPIVMPVAGGPRYVIAADFDGDMHMDLATSNYDGDSVSILKGDGTGHFVITATIPVGNGPEMLALARLNADDHVDLVTCNAIGDNVTPLVGDGTGGFAAGPSYSVGNNPRFLLATDLDGDGLDDLVVANSLAFTVSLERNTGFPTFANMGSLSFKSTVITLQKPVYLAIADLNGDGKKDILATWSMTNVFSVFPGIDGAFVFGAPSVIQTGKTPVGIGAADFDGDDDLDVFVTDGGANTARVFLSYLSDPGVIVDNGAPGTTPIGPWATSDTPFPFGPSSLFSKNGTRYVWEANLAAGDYEVLLWWTVTAKRSKSVPVEVSHADGTSSQLLDQTKDVGEWHSLGSYTFGASGKVTLTAPQGNPASSADAVRFRKLTVAPSGPPRGRVPVTLKPRPDNFRIDRNTVLAFQATLTADNPNESEAFTAAVFSPIGAAEESALIADCKLYIDSNGNGVFDSGDKKLGVARSFSSDVRSIVFDGFRETLADKASVDIFVVADLTPAAVASRTVERLPGSPVLACGAGFGLCLLCWWRRKALAGLSLATALLLTLAIFPAGGCGGGGHGNGPGGIPAPQMHDLQIELSSLVLEGSTTGTPSISEGLPAGGWGF